MINVPQNLGTSFARLFPVVVEVNADVVAGEVNDDAHVNVVCGTALCSVLLRKRN